MSTASRRGFGPGRDDAVAFDADAETGEHGRLTSTASQRPDTVWSSSCSAQTSAVSACTAGTGVSLLPSRTRTDRHLAAGHVCRRRQLTRNAAACPTAKYAFQPVGGKKAQPFLHAPFVVTNLVPGDFDYDGRLDLLLMGEENPGGWWGDKELKLQVHRGQGGGRFSEGHSLQP